MAIVHPGHLVAWVDRCRENLAELRQSYPSLNEAERLQAVRAQYHILSKIKDVCAGKTYFAGVPHPRRRT